MPMKFDKKSKADAGIPTASLPDIVFLLLIFFMVSTVFKEFTGLNVKLPLAKMIEKLPGKRDIAYIWIDRKDRISIDDKIVTVEDVFPMMDQKRRDPIHPLKAVSMRIDERVKMETVYKVQEKLREADALNVMYSAKPAG